MNELVIKQVEFNGDSLLAVQEKETGDIYTSVNFILRGLGFDKKQIEYQREKWSKDKVVSKGTRKFSGTLLNNKTGKDTTCINIKKLPLALAKINITPKMEIETPELTEKLELYQDRCADVLADVFISNPVQPKKEKLSSVNMMVKNVTSVLLNLSIYFKKGIDIIGYPLYN